MQYTIVKKLAFAIEFFTTKGVITAASALTYSTILSIVPICAVVFAIARGFGYTKYIEAWFINLLSSQPQAAELIVGFVNSYLEHTKSGIILGIGLLFMLYTVVMLTRNVEQTFNDIWHVGNRRNIMRTFTDYVAIFFLIPIIIIIMSGLSVFLATIASQTGWEEYLGPIMQLIIDFIPFLLMWVAFSAMYVFMPNTRVKFKCTIVPGLCASIAMYILQWFYINAQMFISNYNAIYGSFAALPLFMLWVQFSWTICLFGAELSYTNQNLEEFAYQKGAKSMSHRYKLMLSLILMSKICKRFDSGGRPYKATELKKETGIPLSIVRDLLYEMTKANLLTEINSVEHTSESRFQPSRPINQLTVGHVVDNLESTGVWDVEFDLKSIVSESRFWKDVLDKRKQYIKDLRSFEMKDI